jgi:Raf kinase inhibitor-like YbhB/YbcL family protein
MSITVTSASFPPNSPIPTKYTEDGENISPPLAWTGVPSGTVELALIVDDPDAPRPEPWVHWIVCKMPATATNLPEAVPRDSDLLQGANTWGRIGYDGPAPPKGHGTHHYHFRLYALNGAIKAQRGVDKNTLLKLMTGHIIAQGELIGTYER